MCDDRQSYYETPFQICIYPDPNYFPEKHLPYFSLGFIAVNPDDETNCWALDDFQKYPIYNGLGRNTVYYSELGKGFEAVRMTNQIKEMNKWIEEHKRELIKI